MRNHPRCLSLRLDALPELPNDYYCSYSSCMQSRMDPEPERCPYCGGVLFKSTANCPWCGKLLHLKPSLRPVTPFLPPPTVVGGLEQPLRPDYRRERGYKIAIAVLLVATIASSGLLVNYALLDQRGAGTPKVSYAISSMDVSSNWSGYLVKTCIGCVYDVQASVKIPHFTCPKLNAIAAFWVGIDGSGSNSVEQVGVIDDCTARRCGFYAFWEWYPIRGYTHEGAYVQENDTLILEVKFEGHEFTGTINDVTQGWTYTDTNQTVVPDAQRLSAEWIVEAPLVDGTIVPLADFDKAYFSNCRATIASRNGSLESFPLVQLTMIDNRKLVKAEPVLPLTGDGGSFSVCWNGTGP